MVQSLSRLRRAVRAARQSPNPAVRFGVGVVDTLHRLVLLLTSPAYRAIAVSRLLERDSLHQTTTLTWMDRYPRIFSACREYFGDGRTLNLLSFGCSTGEEVLTLRRYFPAARIVGAEINAHNLMLCRQHRVDERTAFIHSDPESIRSHGPFDAIFCLAVLQRTPHKVKDDGVQSLKGIYPFEKFDRQVEELDSYLTTNGLLVIHHSQYLFEDSSVADRYVPLTTGPLDREEPLRFDRDSRRIETPRNGGSIFIKQESRNA